MKFKLPLYGLLALAVLSPGAAFAEPLYAESSSPLANAVILVIRHAEQPHDGDSLSPAGDARGKAYVNYFKNFTIDGRPLKIDYMFAAADSRDSRRPRLTLEPIARELGVAIDTRFRNKQFMELADEIESRPHGTSILICWHHGKIPQLLRALDADPGRLLPSGRWPDDVFDWLIELRYDQNGTLFESKRIDEHLSPNE
jgi:hypothetical protein